MSRRRRSRPHHHAPATTDGPRRSASVESKASTSPEPAAPRTAAAAFPRLISPTAQDSPSEPGLAQRESVSASVGIPAVAQAASLPPLPPLPETRSSEPTPQRAPRLQDATVPIAGSLNGDRTGQCTAPQLRRFIKSRPYVPMHELRRRFGINGDDDDVTPVRLDPGLVYVGLPSHEGRLLGDLLRTREIGYELSLDPCTPIVIGVYPMRPIPRG